MAYKYRGELKNRKDRLQLVNGLENKDLLEYQVNDQKMYKLDISSSSFYFDNIESFTFGPFTTRFWLLRKHLMTLDC